MRTLAALLLTLGLISTAVTACGKAKETSSPATGDVRLADADNGKTVSVSNGAQLIIHLTSNPTTGFSWSPNGQGKPVLQQVGDSQFLPPASSALGAAGTEVFTYRAVQAGTVPVILEYRRSFETGVPPEKTFQVTVQVK